MNLSEKVQIIEEYLSTEIYPYIDDDIIKNLSKKNFRLHEEFNVVSYKSDNYYINCSYCPPKRGCKPITSTNYFCYGYDDYIVHNGSNEILFKYKEEPYSTKLGSNTTIDELEEMLFEMKLVHQINDDIQNIKFIILHLLYKRYIKNIPFFGYLKFNIQPDCYGKHKLSFDIKELLDQYNETK